MTGEIVEKTAEAILITDATSKILYVNRSFSEITGYSAGEAVGSSTSLLKSGLHDKEFYDDLWNSLLVHGAWQGEIWNRKKNGEIYLESLSITKIHPAANKEVNYVAIFTQTHHDRLTGLANRHFLLSKLTSALQTSSSNGEPIAVLFIDLDGFKAVNDRFGHIHGDRLLQSVGRALKKAMRASDLAARFGGDEFVVLVLGSERDAVQVAERIRAIITEIAGRAPEWAGITASIGVAVAGGADPTESLSLLKSADEAMYQAKRSGKNRIAIAANVSLSSSVRHGRGPGNDSGAPPSRA